jgi:hypothetical protein
MVLNWLRVFHSVDASRMGVFDPHTPDTQIARLSVCIFYFNGL